MALSKFQYHVILDIVLIAVAVWVWYLAITGYAPGEPPPVGLESYVERIIVPDSTAPGMPVSVTLNVVLSGPHSRFYFIDEQIPASFTVTDPGGLDTSEPGHLKIVVMEAAKSATYTYTVTVPYAAGTYFFNGTYQHEGMETPEELWGENNVSVGQDDDYDDDGWNNTMDCDPFDPSIYPGATEACNGVDEDCDGLHDEDFDADLDNYSTCFTYVVDGTSTEYDDCDDNNASINPGAEEDCSIVDMNCNNMPFDFLPCGIMNILVTTDYFDGRTTNFTLEANLSRIDRMILERMGYGFIVFNDYTGFETSVVLGPPIAVLKYNHVHINTNILRLLNTSATVTLYNLSLFNPRVFRGDVQCPPDICSNVVVEGENMTFNVSYFSTYKIEGHCDDGTIYGNCSLLNQPLFCDEGVLVDNCTYCGCPAGLTCSGNSCVTPGSPAPPPGTGSPPITFLPPKIPGTTCDPGETTACGEERGECRQGTQTCVDGEWGECVGAVGPKAESCNGLDDDCDGNIDEALTGCGTAGPPEPPAPPSPAPPGACPDGPVTAECVCEGMARTTGYCYGGMYSAQDPNAQTMPLDLLIMIAVGVFAVFIIVIGVIRLMFGRHESGAISIPGAKS